MFWQQPRTKWPRTIAILALGYAASYGLRWTHWDVAANVIGFVFVIWLLLPYRSFLPYRLRKMVGENERE